MSVLFSKLNFLQRLLGTAIGFSLFGTGGIILCITLIPFVYLLNKDKNEGSKQVRLVINCIFRLYLKLLEIVGVLKIDSEALDKVQQKQGVLIICNHPSLLDVVIIMSHLKNSQCVVKGKLWKHPFIGGIVRVAGYIRNDLPPEEFLQACEQNLSSGNNIIMFPEGTRSTPGVPLKLQRGLGNLALAARADIQALTLKCAPTSLTKGEKWYNIPNEKVVFTLKVGQYFPIATYQGDQPRSIRVRSLTRDIQHYYNRYLGYE